MDKYDGPALVSDRARRRFHVMVKPGGSTCNLDCTYCYYLSKEDCHGPEEGRMQDDMLERFIVDYIAGVTGPRDGLLLARRRADADGTRVLPPGRRAPTEACEGRSAIDNDLQTNGTLLDEEWCAFLREHRFLVGMSIDGPRELHDLIACQRRAAHLRPGIRAAQLSSDTESRSTRSPVVNRRNARSPVDVYRFLRDEVGSNYMQFIPCVEHKDFEQMAPHTWARRPAEDGDPEAARASDSIVTDWSVDPEDWARSFPGLRRWRPRCREDPGEPLRDAGGAASRPGSQLCTAARSAAKRGRRTRRQRVRLRSLRVSGVSPGAGPAAAPLGELAFSRAQVKFGYAKNETLPQAPSPVQLSQRTSCW